MFPYISLIFKNGHVFKSQEDDKPCAEAVGACLPLSYGRVDVSRAPRLKGGSS